MLHQVVGVSLVLVRSLWLSSLVLPLNQGLVEGLGIGILDVSRPDMVEEKAISLDECLFFFEVDYVGVFVIHALLLSFD